METYICKITGTKKEKTNFFKDVKTPIIAGMEYLNGKIINSKMRKIGYELNRLYFDNAQKDCNIGIEKMGRIINQ